MKWLVPVASGAVFVLSLCLCFWTSVHANTETPFECYVCNSLQDEEGCSYSHVDRKYLKNCSDIRRGTKFDKCRIIRQWIDFDLLGMKANERVIRMCGSQKTERTCYYRAGFGGRQQVCTCETSRCNHAPGLIASQPVVMLLGIVAAILGVQRMMV